MIGPLRWAAVGVAAAIPVLLLGRYLPAREPEVIIGAYATGLRTRSPAQRANAVRAAGRLEGTVIEPGAEFSFNRIVRSWSIDTGYRKAPVSYDGELVQAYGGGVCQASSTLYNAALLAGLRVLERHRHVTTPAYVAPGRDAAVAQYTIDLRFRNPHPWPVRIRTSAAGDVLEMRITAPHALRETVRLESRVISRTRVRSLTRTVAVSPGGTVRFRGLSPGAMGCRVQTTRVFVANDRVVRREALSDDTYRGMHRVYTMAESTPSGP